jgi:prepilin-type N-terminal cleavage/methylation domain-containing protein
LQQKALQQQNDRGLSLVEVLVTVTLLSIISIIIWSVFFQGYSFSQKAISKNLMHQETNLLISDLTNIHRTTKQYVITNTDSDCKIAVKYIGKNDTTNTEMTEVFSHSNMCFKFENTVTNPVKPNDGNLRLELITSDKNIPDNKIKIDTFLYRVKGKGVEYGS